MGVSRKAVCVAIARAHCAARVRAADICGVGWEDVRMGGWEEEGGMGRCVWGAGLNEFL